MPAKLARFSPILNVAAVTTPLIAVSGAADVQVSPENAERMVKALRDRGKPVEWLHFQDEGHVLTRAENQRLFWQRVLEFLQKSCSVSTR